MERPLDILLVYDEEVVHQTTDDYLLLYSFKLPSLVRHPVGPSQSC